MDNRIVIYRKKRLHQRKRRTRKIILFSFLVIISILIISIILTKENLKQTVPLKVESAEAMGSEKDIEDKIEDEVKLDNSGYLPLEKDINAEDAMKVYEVTEALLKGERGYPVRSDGNKVVYLTFDDGPSTQNTANILDILKEYGIKATFFVTGTSIEKTEESKKLLKRIAREGHAIGNHTYSHDYDYLYPDNVVNVENFKSDVEKNNKLIKSVLGKDFSTRIIRFPGGSWSWKGKSSIQPILDEEGYAIIDWNALNEDAQGEYKDSAKLIERTRVNVERLGNNADSIVFLMHDTYGKEETVKALPEIIEYFKCSNFVFKTIK